MKVHNIECPTDLEKRLLIGTRDILELFNANSEYTPSMRVSVLAGVLAVQTADLTDDQVTSLLEGLGQAVALNRIRYLDQLAADEQGHVSSAVQYLAQLNSITKRSKE